MTAQDHADLVAWLEADRRHRGALVRAQAALHLMEDAVVRGAPVLGHSGNDAEYGPRAPRRFGRMAIAAGLGGVLAASTALLAVFNQPHGQTVNLADGSIVTLTEGGDIRADIGGQVRSITLLSGEANFKVAKDPKRPFVVRAGEVSAQATGTVYSVARVGRTGAYVRVDEGSVLVWAREARDQAVLLRAGGKLTLEPGAADGLQLPAPDVAQLSLHDDTIETAVARFNRINHTQIVIADPRVGQVRVVGLFRANDPYAFARAAAAVAGARAVPRGDAIVIEEQPGTVKKN